MKKIISLLLILLLASSCAKKPDTPDTPPAAAGDTEETVKEYNFTCQYIRLYRTEKISGELDDGVTVVRSRAELDSYADGKIDKDYDTLEYTDSQPSFNTLTQKYDDEFFDKNQLVICTVTEPSGNNRHKVERVTDEGVYINRILPESGTDDMAQWAIIVQTEIFDCKAVDVYIDGKNLTGTPADVKVGAGKTSLSIHLPDGWQYRETHLVSEEEEYGIYFSPEGAEGELYLNYQTVFGVCGTGLETEKITVAGYECVKMTWDGKEDFDYISFPVDYGAVLVTNVNANWLSEREDELADILDSIKIEMPTLTEKRATQLAEVYFGESYDGSAMSKYDPLRDTFIITFSKDGTDYSYTVYPTEAVKSENLAARKKEIG